MSGIVMRPLLLCSDHRCGHSTEIPSRFSMPSGVEGKILCGDCKSLMQVVTFGVIGNGEFSSLYYDAERGRGVWWQ